MVRYSLAGDGLSDVVLLSVDVDGESSTDFLVRAPTMIDVNAKAANENVSLVDPKMWCDQACNSRLTSDVASAVQWLSSILTGLADFFARSS